MRMSLLVTPFYPFLWLGWWLDIKFRGMYIMLGKVCFVCFNKIVHAISNFNFSTQKFDSSSSLWTFNGRYNCLTSEGLDVIVPIFYCIANESEMPQWKNLFLRGNEILTSAKLIFWIQVSTLMQCCRITAGL